VCPSPTRTTIDLKHLRELLGDDPSAIFELLLVLAVQAIGDKR
jgi:hypothetical protein